MEKRKVTHVKKKNYKKSAYYLLMGICVAGIVVPSGIIVKAGLASLMAFLHKLKKSGMSDEDILEIESVLDSSIPKTVKSYPRRESDETIQEAINEWNSSTWKAPVVTYPTRKNR